ncbi:MAG: serine/threonine-protein kinase [Acidobacteriota bacterium]
MTFDPDRETTAELPGRTPRGRLSALLHRLFFREEHHREQILLELIGDLDRCRDEPELGRAVGIALLEALSPSRLHLFCRRGHRFRLIYSSDHELDDQVLIPEPTALRDLAPAWCEPRRVQGLGDLRSEDRAFLREWGAHWLAALQHPPRRPEGLRGFLMIGELASPLKEVQLDLLQTLADRTAACQAALINVQRLQMSFAQGPGIWLKECPICGRCFDPEAAFCDGDDHPLEPTLRIERTVAGRYRLERRLGRGGMGLVYLATNIDPAADGGDEKAAIKILAGGDRVAQGRFANEARAGQVLRHPNITRVLDSGTLSSTDPAETDTAAFMVMEYVEGRTLRAAFEKEGPIEPSRTARWFEAILGGVQAAHERGIIHRDLKPENIMLTLDEAGEEVPKILDFGLAKVRDSSPTGSRALTAVGMVIGTLSYMSPEQLAGERVDHRADLFALGVLACEALTGRPPFWAKTLGKMLRAVASSPLDLRVETDAQRAVAEVLARALAKAPGDRYQRAADLRRDLIPALRACGSFPAAARD